MSAPKWWGDWRPTLTPHTGNLQPTDLLECTMIVGGLPVNTAITGAQIIAAASSGATWGSITGTLSSQTDLQSALNAKQDTLVSGTNIKTINGSSILGSGNLTISGSNIYTADGTLTAARTLTQGGFDLTIAGTTSSRFFSNGNVGIGTTTNAGFKLDVNGSSRATSLVINGTASLFNSGISVFQNSTNRAFSVSASVTKTNGAERILFSLNSSETSNQQAMDFGYIGATALTNRYFYLQSSESGVGYGGGVVLQHNGGWASVGTSSYVASAIFNVNSTNRGFLPPRMTNAQMLAIATPAAGLVVYDTTNNKHCGYNGTAWQNFY